MAQVQSSYGTLWYMAMAMLCFVSGHQLDEPMGFFGGLEQQQ